MSKHEWRLPKGLISIAKPKDGTIAIAPRPQNARCDGEKKDPHASHGQAASSMTGCERQSCLSDAKFEALPWPMPPRKESIDSKQANQNNSALAKRESDAIYKTPETSFDDSFVHDPRNALQIISKLNSDTDVNIVAPSEQTIRTQSTTSNEANYAAQALKAKNECEISRDFKDLKLSEAKVTKNVLHHSQSNSVNTVNDLNEPDDVLDELFDDGDVTHIEGSIKLGSNFGRLFPHGHSVPEKTGAREKPQKTRRVEGTGGDDEYGDIDEPIAKKIVNALPKSKLRRPIASQRQTFVNIPRLISSSSDDSNFVAVENGFGRYEKQPAPAKTRSGSVDERQNVESSKRTSERSSRGVIMRANTHTSHVAGIRRAEAGKIMSRDEMSGTKSLAIQESPNPKSLNPAMFFNDDDDVATASPSVLFVVSSSDEDDKQGKRKPNTETKFRDDGSFLTSDILTKKRRGSGEYHVPDSGKFSEADDSSGFVGRLGSGFRRAASSVSKKSSHDVPEAANTDIVVPGTVDEAVCKICVVCRKQLGYRVFVKDTGRKIKVESKDGGRGRYLRASLLIKELGGEEAACSINIRQSRSDGMKTSFAALWDFFQRLDRGLGELG